MRLITILKKLFIQNNNIIVDLIFNQADNYQAYLLGVEWYEGCIELAKLFYNINHIDNKIYDNFYLLEETIINKQSKDLIKIYTNIFEDILDYSIEEKNEKTKIIGKVKYVGNSEQYENSFTLNEVYEVIEIDDVTRMLRIIDDEGSTEYLAEAMAEANIGTAFEYMPFKDGCLYPASKEYFEVVDDPFNILKNKLK